MSATHQPLLYPHHPATLSAFPFRGRCQRKALTDEVLSRPTRAPFASIPTYLPSVFAPFIYKRPFLCYTPCVTLPTYFTCNTKGEL